MEINEVLEKLPKHLLDFVIDQPYNSYTPQDHALWRYVMRQNVKYLSRVAHESYLDGLKATGISIDSIPHMYGMNRILKNIGWAAVAVDGFIPPAAFMEFQAYNVLVIAADIRPIDQIEYTPAPDIIHEAAGHAPIIANAEYAQYLRRFGELGSKAFSSKKDYQVYEAIRHLSILKADPYTPASEIEAAEMKLADIESTLSKSSEMSKIRNLHWWTVEYGLIGSLDNPKIYGAGLLSSIGESFSCLQDDVLKLPYTIEAVDYDFDITTKQPQLFVTADFEQLNKVLDEFSTCMALSKGGIEAISRAVDSGKTGTIVLSSGLQISGTFTDYLTNDDLPYYIKTSGPTTLNYKDKMLEGHGKNYHSDGFSTILGKLKASPKPLELFSISELESIGISEGKEAKLEFESGIVLKGILRKILRKNDMNLILTFSDCLVRIDDRVLFEPSWGLYDLAPGELIVSGYNGPADAVGFDLNYNPPNEKTHKIIHSDKAIKLFNYYTQVRDLREKPVRNGELYELWGSIKTENQDDWLLLVELLEIAENDKKIDLIAELREYLINLKSKKPELANLIDNGLSFGN